MRRSRGTLADMKHVGYDRVVTDDECLLETRKLSDLNFQEFPRELSPMIASQIDDFIFANNCKIIF
jgi:hypothetical protein